ncbi:MAG: iron ABC transporter permease, partial [Lachnospiraceae bacterium]|nr:iron ABC transporter permease [Lachnospiraceae bacterium]
MNSTIREQAKKIRRGKIISILLAGGLVIVTAFFSLFVGSSGMPFSEGLKALFGNGTVSGVRIMQNIRLPRILAALIAGAGLSVSGLMMQTVLNNPMASPSTLGVSNAAVFGANLSIIGFAGGFLSTGHNPANYMTGANPFAVSSVAFVFAVLSVILILGLSKLRDFSPNVVVLAGIAIGALFTAATTILQFYATDVGLSAAVIWNFGDLGRATYETDLIIAGVVIVGIAFSAVMSWRFNALLSGAETARSMGIRVGVLRFLALFFSSVITAVAVS